MISIKHGKRVLLVLMDRTAEFDAVNHNVLFSRLKDMYDLSGKVLEWYQSYLEQHSQRVFVHGILSDVRFVLSGLLQVLFLFL